MVYIRNPIRPQTASQELPQYYYAIDHLVLSDKCGQGGECVLSFIKTPCLCSYEISASIKV